MIIASVDTFKKEDGGTKGTNFNWNLTPNGIRLTERL